MTNKILEACENKHIADLLADETRRAGDTTDSLVSAIRKVELACANELALFEGAMEETSWATFGQGTFSEWFVCDRLGLPISPDDLGLCNTGVDGCISPLQIILRAKTSAREKERSENSAEISIDRIASTGKRSCDLSQLQRLIDFLAVALPASRGENKDSQNTFEKLSKHLRSVVSSSGGPNFPVEDLGQLLSLCVFGSRQHAILTQKALALSREFSALTSSSSCDRDALSPVTVGTVPERRFGNLYDYGGGSPSASPPAASADPASFRAEILSVLDARQAVNAKLLHAIDQEHTNSGQTDPTTAPSMDTVEKLLQRVQSVAADCRAAGQRRGSHAESTRTRLQAFLATEEAQLASMNSAMALQRSQSKKEIAVVTQEIQTSLQQLFSHQRQLLELVKKRSRMMTEFAGGDSKSQKSLSKTTETVSACRRYLAALDHSLTGTSASGFSGKGSATGEGSSEPLAEFIDACATACGNELQRRHERTQTTASAATATHLPLLLDQVATLAASIVGTRQELFARRVLDDEDRLLAAWTPDKNLGASIDAKASPPGDGNGRGGGGGVGGNGMTALNSNPLHKAKGDPLGTSASLLSSASFRDRPLGMVDSLMGTSTATASSIRSEDLSSRLASLQQRLLQRQSELRSLIAAPAPFLPGESSSWRRSAEALAALSVDDLLETTLAQKPTASAIFVVGVGDLFLC